MNSVKSQDTKLVYRNFALLYTNNKKEREINNPIYKGIKKNKILCKHVTISSTMRKKAQEIFIRDDLRRIKVDI